MLIHVPDYDFRKCEQCKGIGRRTARGLHEVRNFVQRKPELDGLKAEIVRWGKIMHPDKRAKFETRIAELERDLKPRETICTECDGQGRFRMVRDQHNQWVLADVWETRDPAGIAYMKKLNDRPGVLKDIDNHAQMEEALRAIRESVKMVDERKFFPPPQHDAVACLREAEARGDLVSASPKNDVGARLLEIDSK